MAARKNLKGTNIKLADDEMREQRDQRFFLNVYVAEWKLDNGLRRIIRNGKMLLLKEGKPVKRYEIRGENVVILTPPAVGSPMQG